MKGKLNLVTTVKKKKIPNTWQLCLGPSNFGWCSSGFRSTNPSGSNPSTLSSPFSSPKTVEEFEEIFGEWLFWWPLCTFKMSSLVLFFFFLNISLTGKPGRLCRGYKNCVSHTSLFILWSAVLIAGSTSKEGEVIALRNLRHASYLPNVDPKKGQEIRLMWKYDRSYSVSRLEGSALDCLFLLLTGAQLLEVSEEPRLSLFYSDAVFIGSDRTKT